MARVVTRCGELVPRPGIFQGHEIVRRLPCARKRSLVARVMMANGLCRYEKIGCAEHVNAWADRHRETITDRGDTVTVQSTADATALVSKTLPDGTQGFAPAKPVGFIDSNPEPFTGDVVHLRYGMADGFTACQLVLRENVKASQHPALVTCYPCRMENERRPMAKLSSHQLALLSQCVVRPQHSTATIQNTVLSLIKLGMLKQFKIAGRVYLVITDKGRHEWSVGMRAKITKHAGPVAEDRKPIPSKLPPAYLPGWAGDNAIFRRHAQKRYACTAQGGEPANRTHGEGCTGHIEIGDAYVEYVGEVAAYSSGARIALPCALLHEYIKLAPVPDLMDALKRSLAQTPQKPATAQTAADPSQDMQNGNPGRERTAGAPERTGMVKLVAIFVQESVSDPMWRFIVRPEDRAQLPENFPADFHFACEIRQQDAYDAIQPIHHENEKAKFEDALSWAREHAVSLARYAYAYPEEALADTRRALGLR